MYDNIPIENIEYDGSELLPGVSEVGVYVALLKSFQTIAKPADLKNGTTLEEVATIAEAHTFKAGEGFHKVEISADSGSVDSTPVGDKGALNLENTFTALIPGTGARNAGWVRKHLNLPCIVIVRERNGDVKQIGSELCPARMTDATGASGAAPGDKKGFTVNFSALSSYPAPQYDATIEQFDAEPAV